MRVNVYQEELTGDVELVEKRDVIGADGSPVTFYGVRIWLLGPDTLHRTEHDDDRPAITFWVGSADDAAALFTVMDAGTNVTRQVYAKLRAAAPGEGADAADSWRT